MSTPLRIHAIFLGPIESHFYEGEELRTAGYKRPVQSARLTPLGLVGDEQADKRFHGGPDQALCVYSLEHYADWQRILGRALPPGAFSENLTLAGLRESEVCIGDVYALGERATAPQVQISLPRQPCERVALKLDRPDMVPLIRNSGWTGLYLRVLEIGDGEVRRGDALRLVARPAHGVTVEQTCDVFFQKTRDRERLLHVLQASELAQVWRQRLEARRGAVSKG
jgi:MOSC domain-containing protein YiiM